MNILSQIIRPFDLTETAVTGTTTVMVIAPSVAAQATELKTSSSGLAFAGLNPLDVDGFFASDNLAHPNRHRR